MGNGLATSDGADFQAKRVALGFAALVANLTQAQKDALRQQFSVTYSYDPDGYITRVVDQQGLATTYVYSGKTTAGDPQSSALNQDNLLSVTDRNGSGATTSDSAYFRASACATSASSMRPATASWSRPSRRPRSPRCSTPSRAASPTTRAATC